MPVCVAKPGLRGTLRGLTLEGHCSGEFAETFCWSSVAGSFSFFLAKCLMRSACAIYSFKVYKMSWIVRADGDQLYWTIYQNLDGYQI